MNMRLIPLAAIIAGFFIAGAYGARLTHAQEADGLAAPASATISARLVEDLNDNGQFDAEDGPPSQRTLVQLVPWATPDRFVRVLTADDGSFSFVNVPEGDYTLSVWWMSGFVGDSSERLPHALRIVLRVTSDGAIATPSPLPTTWPELPTEEFNPERDGTIIGSVPDVILLKLKPPGLFPYPVEVGDTAGGPPPIGVVDVGQALRERPAALPPTGGGPRDDADSLLRWLGAGVLALAVLSGLTVARRRARA